MAYAPIAYISPQYNSEDYANWWLKAYSPRTTTPKLMSLTKDGSVTVAKLELNEDGFINTAGDAIVIPYIDGLYDLWLFPTEAEADANDTSNAIKLAEDVQADLDGTPTIYVKTVAEMQQIENLNTDMTVRVAERADALFQVTDFYGVINPYNVIASATDGNFVFVLRVEGAINIKQLGALGDYDINAATGSDDTLVFQHALSTFGLIPILVPTGTYLITDTLDMTDGQSVIGFLETPAVTNASNRFHNTTIAFAPAVAGTDLWDTEYKPGSADFTRSMSIKNIICIAINNNARYGLALNSAAQSTFENFSLNGSAGGAFQTSIYARQTLTNTFKDCLFANASVSHLVYDNLDPQISTTDTYKNCSFTLSPLFLEAKNAQMIRFSDCLFESLEQGADIYKDSVNIIFSDCYAEDVPSINDATKSMFKVGVNGTTKQGATQLAISGGMYGGRNAGGVGSFLDVDDIDEVSVICAFATRYTNYLTTTATTPDRAVTIFGGGNQSITTFANDSDKIIGTYRKGQFTGGPAPRSRTGLQMVTTGIASTLPPGDVTAGAKSYSIPVYDLNENFIGHIQVYV